MTNTTVTLLYIPVSLITAIICMSLYVRDRGIPNAKHLVRLCLVILGWQLSIIGYFLTDDVAIARFVHDIKLVFVAIAPVQLLILTIHFYNLPITRRNTLVLNMLMVIPLMTAVLAITSPLHNLIRSELTILELEPLHVTLNVRGIWFWVHTGYSYIISLTSGIIIIIQHRRQSKTYRLPSSLLLIGILITIGSNVLVMFNVIPDAVDVTLIGTSISLIFLYSAITRNEQASFLVLARDEIFNFLEDYIFILDGNRAIADCNASAKKWLASVGVNEDIDDLSLDDVIAKLTDVEGKIHTVEEEDGLDVYHMVNNQTFIYHLRERELTTLAGKKMGTYAIFTDITRYRLLIDHLELSVGIDALTGLGSRRSYEEAKEKLDTSDALPLAIILGDINELKIVNDTYGHQSGDMLICAIARTLVTASAPGGNAYRIGGDEFVILLPKTTEQEAEAVCQRIHASLSGIDAYPFRPSIALGMTVKKEMHEELESLISQADQNMYTRKENDRRRRRG